jgi:small subunit ribosomal protein S6
MELGGSMPTYETLCILHPELPDVQVKEMTAWMTKILEGGQGAMLLVDEWGMRELAYHIKKQGRGHYVRLEYNASPAALKELERNLRLNEKVLRFLSVVCSPTVKAAPPAPAVTPTAPSETNTEG